MGIPAWANSGEIERLRSAVVASVAASDRLTQWVITLTAMLVLLTAALVVLTVVLVLK